MGKSKEHSVKILRNWQEVYDCYDELMEEEKRNGRERYTKPSYYVDKIALKTGYSASRVSQLITSRYKKNK